MPQHAIDEDHVNAVLRLDQIASYIAALALGEIFMNGR